LPPFSRGRESGAQSQVADVFHEVDEQLRSERVLNIIRKGWPYALGAVVAVVVGFGVAWGLREYRAGQEARASEAYNTALEALAKPDLAAAERGFAQVAEKGPPAYRALAMMQQAGLRSSDPKKTQEAVALLDKAAETAKNPIVGDAARLKAAYLVFDTASLADLEARLTPLTEAGRPYANLAREALAVKRLASGNTAEAKQALSLLAISPESGEALQARAQLGQAIIDAGHAGQLSAIAKAASALPPSAVQAPAAAAPTSQAPAAPPAQSQAGAAQ
jgi:hypothetical protein